MSMGFRCAGLGVLAGLALVYSVSTTGASDSQDAVKAVRAILDRQAADWNKGDLEGFLTGYWNSPKVVFQSGGQRLKGYEAMRTRYRQRYQAEGRAMGRLDFSELELETLGPDAVLGRGRWGLTMPDKSKPGGLFTVIFRRLPEGWKIVHDHTSTDEPPQPKAAQ